MPCSSSPSQHPPTLPLSSSPNSPHKLSRSFFKSWWDLFTCLSSILLRKVWIKIKSLQVSGLHIATPAGAAGITLKLILESASKSIGSHRTPKSIRYKVQHSWRIPLTVIVEGFGRQKSLFSGHSKHPPLEDVEGHSSRVPSEEQPQSQMHLVPAMEKICNSGVFSPRNSHLQKQMGWFHLLPRPVAGASSNNILFHFNKFINGAAEIKATAQTSAQVKKGPHLF